MRSRVARSAFKQPLKLHLAAIELALCRDPYLYSTPFSDENHRLIETPDYIKPDGVVVMAFIVIDPARHVVDIKWIETRPSSDGDDDGD